MLEAVLYESISSNKVLKYYEMCIHVSHESFDVLIFKKIFSDHHVTACRDRSRFIFAFVMKSYENFFRIFDYEILDNFEILSKDQSRLLVFWSKDMLNDLQMGFI